MLHKLLIISVIISVIIFIIELIILLTLTKTPKITSPEVTSPEITPPEKSILDSIEIQNALTMSNLYIIGGEVNMTKVIFNSTQSIIDNFELFINTYLPMFDLSILNRYLSSYGSNSTIQEIIKNNININILNGITLFYLDFIYNSSNYIKLLNLFLIGVLILESFYGKDFAQFAYNKNYLEINQIRIYYYTQTNRDKLDSQIELDNMFTQMPLVCGSTNLCYITTNNLKSNTNKPDIINKNLMYIERGIYYSIINTLSMYDNNINKVLSSCPDYDLTGLVKKDVVSSVCYGCPS